jgi:hypothetical protein
MFGSNFMQNFGIPEMPDPAAPQTAGPFGSSIAAQGEGGATITQNQQDIGAAGRWQSPVQGNQTYPYDPAGQPFPAPAAPLPGIGSPGPMGGGVLSPGAGATPQMPGVPVDPQGAAPAAGISSPFGRPQL